MAWATRAMERGGRGTHNARIYRAFIALGAMGNTDTEGSTEAESTAVAAAAGRWGCHMGRASSGVE